MKDAIRKGALADAAVGKAPNDDYGFGKLRVYQSLYGEAPIDGSPPVLDIERVTAAPGESASVPVAVHDPDEPSGGITIELDRDYDGVFEEKLDMPSFGVRYDAEGTYWVKVRATDATGRTASAGEGCGGEPAAMVTLVAFHAVLALLLPWALRHDRRAMPYVAALAPLATVIWAVRQSGAVAAGEPIAETVDWAAELGLVLQFRLDGLSWVMLLLVGGVGVGTLLTLLFLPALYALWFRVARAPKADAVLADAGRMPVPAKS